jgi:biopolymer transport protein ExbB/TolQ
MGMQFFRTKAKKLAFFGIAAGMFMVSYAFGQAAAPAEGAPAAAPAAGEAIDPNLVVKRVIAGFMSDFTIKATGAWLFQWPIVISFAAGMGIAAERYYTIVMKSKVNMKKFTDQMIKFVEVKDYDKAIALCAASPAGALPQLIKAGLEAAKRNMGTRAVQDAIDEKTLSIMPIVTSRTSWISVLANVSTLLGLMGTIFGLMYTFAGLDLVLNPKAKANLLTSGIATAMNTTLLGLICAIPLTLLFQYLSQASKRLIDDIDESSVRIINALSR